MATQATPAKSPVQVFTDGACLNNPGPGGWAALLVAYRDGTRHEKMLVGGEPGTTNNRMEMSAVLNGLRAMKRPCAIEVVTDSQYVIKGMTEWIHGWKKRGWKNAKKKPVENRDLWEALEAAAATHSIKWTWVKGHAGHPENERVDQAASDYAHKVRRGEAS